MHTPDQTPEESPFAAPLEDPVTPSRPVKRTKPASEDSPHEIDFAIVIKVWLISSCALVALGIGVVSHALAGEDVRASGFIIFLNHVVALGMDLAGLSLTVSCFRYLTGRKHASQAAAVGLLLFGFFFVALLVMGSMR